VPGTHRFENSHAAVSDEADNEELLPDERPRRSRYEKLLTPSLSSSDEERVSARTGEEKSIPFQLQPSTAADAPARRRSRGRQGRDPVCSKYRMAWVLVFFDLPVGTPEERKAATNFRKDLIHDGYMMVQFSVYARPCGTADRVETQVRRLKSRIPAKGEVRGLMISDAQWGRMIVMRSQQTAEAEKMPAQMQFF
jgi:CRISPR-associated protein Cas2